MPILTVDAPVSDRSLVPLARVKLELGLTNTTFDALITNWIRDDSDAVCEACGVAADQRGRRTFLTEDVSIAFRMKEVWTDPSPLRRYSETRPIVLPWRIPFVATGATLVNPDQTLDLMAGTDFEVEPTTSLAWRIDSLGEHRAWEWASITFTGTAGWDLADVPQAAVNAVIEMIKLQIDDFDSSGKRRNSAVKMERLDGQEYEYWVGAQPGETAGIPGSVMDSLRRSGLVAARNG